MLPRPAVCRLSGVLAIAALLLLTSLLRSDLEARVAPLLDAGPMRIRPTPEMARLLLVSGGPEGAYGVMVSLLERDGDNVDARLLAVDSNSSRPARTIRKRWPGRRPHGGGAA